MKLLYETVRGNYKRMVSYYLLASYAYYVLDDPLMSDSDFDTLCKDMLDNFDKLSHPHKHLVAVEALEAGTCLIREFPNIVKDSAVQLLSQT